MGNVNISKVAKMANVSQTTVSRVLNGSVLVKEDTAKRVQQVIQELGYQPNVLARGLRSNETKTIGVVISNVLNPFFSSVVRGIEDVANKANYNIMLCNSDENPEKEMQYIQAMLRKQVDGLILTCAGGKADYKAIVGNKPVVFVDRKPEGESKDHFDAVLVQNREGSFAAVSQMIKAGYRRIGIITGSNVATTGYQRYEGYEQALKQAGLPVEKELVKFGGFFGYTGYDYARELVLQEKCDAIFAANNMILLGVLKALSELKLSIPKDVGISAFDDMDWMQFCQPQITAVRQPTYEMGMATMNLLLERIAGSTLPPRQVSLPVELVVRESSKERT